MGLFYKGYKLKNTQNLNLSLYDGYDLMYITRQSDSLNSNMKLIDGAIKDLKEDTSNTKEELDYYKMSNDATTQALSNRIDSLVVSAGDSSAEVLNARVSSDGKTYPSLRDRLDTEYNTLTLNKANTSDLNVESERIDNLETTKANISALTAESLRITSLESSKADVDTLNAESARINKLELNKVDTSALENESTRLSDLISKKANKSDLSAESLRIDSLEDNSVTKQQLKTESERLGSLITGKADSSSLDAESSRIDNLESSKADVTELNKATTRISSLESNKADIASLNAESARIDKLITDKADIDLLTTESARIDNLETTKANISDLNTETARIEELVATKASIEDLNTESARIDTLESNTVTTETLNAEKARIDALETGKADISALTAESARVDELLASKADVSALNAESARIDSLETDKADVKDLTAESARIDSLETNKLSIKDFETDKARIDALETNKADITSLNAEIARIDTLEAGKADIDLANVNNAWIANGVIKDASIANEKVISVSANKLTAGTIDASKITVTNLNADNITVGTINGARIGDSSIDLGKLSQEVPTKEYLDSVEQKLQEEIDGTIETFTVSEIPTLNNEPAVNWTTDDIKSTHVGDLCYVVNNANDNDGFCYRFQYNGTAYSWALIKDNDVTKAIKDIAELGGEVTQFKSDYTSKVSEIDGGIESLKSRTTTIETTYSTKMYTDTKTSDALTSANSYADNKASSTLTEAKSYTDSTASNTLGEANDYTDTAVSTKVEKSVFNTLKNTVDENSANITSLTETVTTKADNSTVTTLSNTVNEVKQTADANSSSISKLTTTVNSKADGSKVTTLENKTSTIEQNLSGVATRVSTLESENDGLDTRLTAAESKITDDAIVSTVTSSKTYKDALSDKVDTSVYNTKMQQLDNSISLKATATEVYTKTQANAAFDAKGSAATAKSEAISSANSYTDTATTDMATEEFVTSQGYLTVTSDAITSKVSKNEVIAAIEQTPETIRISAGKIKLEGAVTFTSFDSSLQTTINNKAETSALEDVRTTADGADANALSALETTDALDDDLTQFKANEYSQVNERVGELVNYKDDNEKVIANIQSDVSNELVARKFARIEDGSLVLGATNSTTAVLTNEQFGFYTPNSEVPASYFGKDNDAWAFNIERGIIKNDLRFGGFQWIARSNKNMSLKWLK